MTTDEAFQKALDAVQELIEEGIKVDITPVGSTASPPLIDKYKGPERIPSHKWINVNFSITSDNQAELIHQKCLELHKQGITFDSGGGMLHRDWELDWSFRYTGIADQDSINNANLFNEIANGL